MLSDAGMIQAIAGLGLVGCAGILFIIMIEIEKGRRR